MAKLDITKSTHRIRIYLFNDRIRIRKSYEAAIGEVISAEINWTGITLATAEFANEFANWLTVASGLADDLDRLIKAEADFGRVVVRSGGRRLKVLETEDQIYIYHPAAWLKD